MKAKVVYLVDCDYPEDYENYHFNVGIFTSFENAKSTVIEDIKNEDDEIVDGTTDISKNNRQLRTYITMKGKKYNIFEYALDTKWDKPIEKEYIKED